MSNGNHELRRIAQGSDQVSQPITAAVSFLHVPVHREMFIVLNQLML